jgi:deoxyribose-phosphate aldolase
MKLLINYGLGKGIEIMKIFPDDIRRMIDASLLRPDVTMKEIERFIEIEKKERFICCFLMPCYTELLVDAFRDDKDILVGGPIGFPTGTDTTASKVQQAKGFVEMGADELDLVINIGWLKSGRYDDVLRDLKSVIAVRAGKPVKVILEVTLLTDDEIRKGCKLVIKAGADFVKTGTGFQPNPTTLHHTKIIKDAVGNRIKVKAAGGIRDFETFIAMVRQGVTRFGISIDTAVKILNESRKYEDGIEI